MNCDQCRNRVDSDEARAHFGRILCEECYMDALSPVRTCDPWKAHSAKTFELNSTAPVSLNPTQERILQILQQTGGITPDALRRRMGADMKKSDLERAFAALKHMGRVRAEKQNGAVMLKAGTAPAVS